MLGKSESYKNNIMNVIITITRMQNVKCAISLAIPEPLCHASLIMIGSFNKSI